MKAFIDFNRPHLRGDSPSSIYSPDNFFQTNWNNYSCLLFRVELDKMSLSITIILFFSFFEQYAIKCFIDKVKLIVAWKYHKQKNNEKTVVKFSHLKDSEQGIRIKSQLGKLGPTNTDLAKKINQYKNDGFFTWNCNGPTTVTLFSTLSEELMQRFIQLPFMDKNSSSLGIGVTAKVSLGVSFSSRHSVEFT